MREIDTSNLLRYQTGKYKGKIDWSNNVGSKLLFTYDDISGEIEIIDYIKGIPNSNIVLKYNNSTVSTYTPALLHLKIPSLFNCEKISKKYKYDIGDIVHTKSGDIEILEQNRVSYSSKNNNFGKGYKVRCVACKNEFVIREDRFGGCRKCGDGVSYPEKFIHSLLQQLNINYKPQKKFKWSDNKVYDIFIKNYNCIIETHGEQHYKNSGFRISLEEQQEIDLIKENLANKNNIKHYIALNCSKSEQKFIKESIMESHLPKLLNFKENDINWIECDLFACSSLIKQACDLWNENKSIKYISEKLNINSNTIIKYLRKGNKLKMCIYDKHLNMSNARKKDTTRYKPVRCINTGEIFESQTAATKSYNIYKSGISDCCAGRIPSAGKHPITKEQLHWEYYYPETINASNM